MFALLLIAAALLTHRVTSQIQGVGSGIACVATAATVYFLATSPILIQNAVISMLELLGCLWVILLLWVCWRIDNDLGGRWTPVLFLALMLFVITLTKYSFGVTAIPAAVAAILIGTKSGNAKRSQLIEAGLVLVVLAASLGLWFMAAGLRGALRFAFDQPQYAPLLSAENLFYYPRAWLKDFHLHPVFGLATVLLAIWGAIKGWNRLTVRAASWVACFSLLILTVSLNNQPRHFVFASPGLWFLAALGLAHLLVKLVKAVRSRSLQSVSLIIMFAFLGMSAFQRAKALEPELTYAFEGQYGDRNQAMQSYIIDNVDLEDRVLILGLFDQLNATAIRWQMAIETGRAPSEIRVETEPQVDLGRIRLPSDAADGDDYEALVLRAAAMEAYYSQIVVLRSRNSTDPYVVAAPSVLRDFKSMSRRFDDYEIEIFDLSDRR
jgi:hypothetical protein